MAIKLDTTDTERHALLEILEATRESSSTCKVPKEALRHLLADHDALCQAARGARLGFDVGSDQRSLQAD